MRNNKLSFDSFPICLRTKLDVFRELLKKDLEHFAICLGPLSIVLKKLSQLRYYTTVNSTPLTVRAAFLPVHFRSGNYFLTLFLFYLKFLSFNSISRVSIASVVNILSNASNVTVIFELYICNDDMVNYVRLPAK